MTGLIGLKGGESLTSYCIALTLRLEHICDHTKGDTATSAGETLEDTEDNQSWEVRRKSTSESPD